MSEQYFRVILTVKSLAKILRRIFMTLFMSVNFSGTVKFLRDLNQFIAKSELPVGLFPITEDFWENAGVTSGHYFYQDLIVAQKIFDASPGKHVDVGSSVLGFVSHVATFRPIEILDIRPLESKVANISFVQADLMQPSHVRTDSLSCLHALEHFGLGRYGDDIDPLGHIKGFQNLVSMVDLEGTFYLSFPISSKERVEFNAHRVFHPLSVFDWPGSQELSLSSFSYVDDLGDLHENSSPQAAAEAGLSFGCGIYTFRKISAAQSGTPKSISGYGG